MDRKSLYDISWQVPEEEYRADPALSYSTLSRFQNTGFNNLDKLFDKVESPSLTFGSAVDSIITGGLEEFNERFIIADYPECSDTILNIVKKLFNLYNASYNSLDDIPDKDIIRITETEGYQRNWKPETRAKVIKEKGKEYYSLLYISMDKTILNTEEYEDVMHSVDALKTSESTKFYFAPNNPFNTNIVRYYQLKFKGEYNKIKYRCMADLIVVDYEHKIIYPVDLKTSSHKEWDFFKSFIDWNYQIQARLYWRIIRQNLDKDEYFKDFKLMPYKFIVVNKQTLTPLVWEFGSTEKEGTLIFGKNKQIELRDPYEIGEELSYYLSSRPKVPKAVQRNNKNSIEYFLNTI